MSIPHPLGRFVNDRPPHYKFWECLADGTGRYLTRWGRIGTKGSSKPNLNSVEASKKINEKLREGYRHISGSPTSVMEETERALRKSLSELPASPAPRTRSRL